MTTLFIAKSVEKFVTINTTNNHLTLTKCKIGTRQNIDAKST